MIDYMDVAKSHLGVTEIKGIKNNELIVKWWIKLGAWFREDETPWCGLFVALCLKDTGYVVPTQFYRALKWADYGLPCSLGVGAIAIMKREGGGHVAFVAGKTKEGKIVLLGGNQGDKVCYTAVSANKILTYRRPDKALLAYSLPTIDVFSQNSSFA